jgi:FkbM family methyltransferase
MSPFALVSVYKKFPTVPVRVRIFNLFRYFFTLPWFERFLVNRLEKGNLLWRKFIPPLYFYESGNIRHARRYDIDYILDISNLIEHSIYFYNFREEGTTRLLSIIRPSDVILDIGANIGFHTLNFASGCPRGKVYAFEPDTLNFASLKTNIESNRFTNINAMKLALGARTEKRTLYQIYDNNPGGNRILDSEPKVKFRSEEVKMQSLDEVAATLQLNGVDLMKVDVEGFELFVLQGAENLIRKYRPTLFIELAEVNLRQQGCTSRQLIDFLEELGYEIQEAATLAKVDKEKLTYHCDMLCFPKL